jgi:hypothetical protein
MKVKIFKLTAESVAKLRWAIQSDDFESDFKPTYLSTSNNGFSENDLKKVEGFYEMSDITLKGDKNGKFDFENSQLLFQALRFLTPAEADDQRLWVYLSNCHFYDYTITRWLTAKSTKDVFSRRLLYEGNGRGARTRNSISRLWWTAYLTLDTSSGTDDWSLTKAIFEVQDLQVGLLERNMGSYPNILKGFLRFYIENRPSFNSTIIQQMLKELNNIGGVYNLPSLDEAKIQMLLKALFEKNKK